MYQSQKTVFDHIFNHREESWNYDAERCIFHEIRSLEMWPNTVRLSEVDGMLKWTIRAYILLTKVYKFFSFLRRGIFWKREKQNMQFYRV